MTAVLSEAQQLAYANAQAADGRVNVELETDDGMVLNMGPQHPATHGTLRIIARLDGDISWLEGGGDGEGGAAPDDGFGPFGPGHPVAAGLAGLALLVALGYAVAGLGALAASMAPVLLGPAQAERIAALEARSARLAERNRLARELHDSVGHALTVATLQAGAAREEHRTGPVRDCGDRPARIGHALVLEGSHRPSPAASRTAATMLT